MNILFIGNYALGPGGEAADESHLARELERLGHVVTRVPRDEWREYVIEDGPQGKYKVPENIPVDIIIIAKWHHFFDGEFIKYARGKYKAPVFYWVWDYMEGNSVEDWHMKMAAASDLYLSGEIGLAHYYHSNNVPFYYFQFDSTDGDFPAYHSNKKLYDIVYLGSCLNQNGRIDLLKEIDKQLKEQNIGQIKVFGYDFEEWRKQGFDAEPAKYEMDFNRIVAESKIVLGTTAGPNCYGYWSNRVGKVLWARGFLLQRYTPGMEQFMADLIEYYSTPEEAVKKIKHYLDNPDQREEVIMRATGQRERWISEFKVRQLVVLAERFINDPDRKEWMLP